MRERSLLSYEKRRREEEEEEGKREPIEGAVHLSPHRLPTRQWKRKPESRTKKQFTLPFRTVFIHLISSFLFSDIPLFAEVERRGGRKEERGGVRARDGKERRVEER